ncbi:Hypothetical Protein FCC1311_067702 [Hondaea fermentalgiana]|uniref:Uncharacterized protein n=1 Tax=Hondaea fermentalgiana TaxID=2315210 RepID=A0A2R5GI32_9STRA|nr:Hypothetical Protein FCC1311_067702 [Hondaea fermentalgiana]|eukprot:GBG30550.1 Hypothetical Protein FCC1311_067702 [Hondaea fermentalgiana]
MEAEVARLREELSATRVSATQAARESAAVVESLQRRLEAQKDDDKSRAAAAEEETKARSEADAVQEERLRSANDRMLALDRRFRELWRDMKAENGRVREEAETYRATLEEERKVRAAAEERAQKAERRAIVLMKENLALQAHVKQVQEKMSLMRTIAKIRDETDDVSEVLGFDGLVRKIGHVTEEVERQVSFAQNPTR